LANYDYFTLVYESTSLVQQISLIIILYLTNINLYSYKISVNTLLLMNLILLILFFTMIPIFNAMTDIFSTFITMSVLFGLSPVIHTLTSSISQDSVNALVILLIVVHLYTHDYSYVNGYSTRYFYSNKGSSLTFQ
jgi:phosphatidylinositol N-acetylglucosaminyltransferase subunit C